MTAISSTDTASPHVESPRPKLEQPMGIKTILIFLAIMALGLFFAAYSIYGDIAAAGTPVTNVLPFGGWYHFRAYSAPLLTLALISFTGGGFHSPVSASRFGA